MEDNNTLVVAKRVAGIINQVCRYARTCGYAQYNIADGLPLIVKKRPRGNYGLPAITTPEGVSQMLKDIRAYALALRSGPYIRTALQLFPYTMLRAQELAKAQWDDVDLEKGIWRIPPENIKKGRPHDIPLARQVKELLSNLWRFRTNKFLFPSGSKEGHITGNGMNKALHAAGVPKDEMTLHGFRKVWGTLARDAQIPDKLVEKHLAHLVGDPTSRAYDKAEYWDLRCYLMQWWADYLDALRDDKELPTPDFTIINKYV